MKYEVKILVVGPQNCGKSRLVNFLADLKYELPENLKPTKTLRIVEYDLPGIDIDGTKCNVDVQLWDTSGNDMYNYYWSVYRQYVQGIVFVSNPDDINTKKLEALYNYFINVSNFSHKACVLVTLLSEGNSKGSSSLGTQFPKLSEITANIDLYGEKFKQDFAKYIVNVAKMNKTQ